MWHLKALIEDACLASFEKLFQYFAPLTEKHVCSLAELFTGSLKSVFVFRRLRAASTALLVKISQTYLGAMPLRHLKTARFTCVLINCSIVFQPKLWIRGLLGASKWLLVTMRAALLWSLSSSKMLNYSSPKQSSSIGSEAQRCYYKDSLQPPQEESAWHISESQLHGKLCLWLILFDSSTWDFHLFEHL